MSKVNKNVGATPSRGPAYVISTHTPDSVVGCVLEIVEALGLPEKQEISAKNLIKDVIYKKLLEGIYISDELHNLISAAKYKLLETNPFIGGAVKLEDLR
jgi:hypothetical protein